jgi:tetratricopeptide (TPR) repeat protein
MSMKNIPELGYERDVPELGRIAALVVRTDFSDERAWQIICEVIEEPVGEEGFQANVTFVSDPAFEGATVKEIVEHANKDMGFLFIVDGATIVDEEHPILVVDLLHEPGRTFRVIPSEMWDVENNLSIGNMDFWDFADSTDDDGVFRGWQTSDRDHQREVESLSEQAYATSLREHGPEHLDTATNALALAHVYRNQGKVEQAEPLYLQALTIYEQQLGPQDPSTISSLNYLANFYRDQGKVKQAEPLYQRALAIYEQQLGPEVLLNMAGSLNALAHVYQDQGKVEQAEPLYLRALAICEQQLGPQHPLTASSLYDLANLYQDQGKVKQAEPLYLRALAIYERRLGPQNHWASAVRERYISLLRAMGRNEEANAVETTSSSSS